MQLPPDAFAARVLCRRHNSALAGLDDIAVHLFNAFDDSAPTNRGETRLYFFNGHDLERWILKLLCGLKSSGNLNAEGDDDRLVPRRWVDVLFGTADFEGSQGLFVCREIGHRFAGPHGVQVQAVYRQNRISGLGVWLCGYEMILALLGFGQRQFEGRAVVHRPLELYTRGRGLEKSVAFHWVGAADLGTISTTLPENDDPGPAAV